MTNIFSKFFILSLSLFVLLPAPVKAAEIFFSPEQAEISSGHEFRAGLFIDTAGEEINAIEGRISYSLNSLELKEIRDGNSLISFWMDKPQIPRDCSKDNICTVFFSGIIPGGYSDKQGLILSFVFLSKNTGASDLHLDGLRVLKNDGQGTPASVSHRDLQLNIKEGEFDLIETGLGPAVLTLREIVDSNSQADKEAPEIFSPEIVSDPLIFDGRKVLIFSTQDKSSGIDYYEVKEGRGDYKRAESPYLLSDQSLSREIRVKAVDRFGNERVAIISGPASGQGGGYLRAFLAALALIAALAYVYFKRYRRLGKHKNI